MPTPDPRCPAQGVPLREHLEKLVETRVSWSAHAQLQREVTELRAERAGLARYTAAHIGWAAIAATVIGASLGAVMVHVLGG